MTASLVAALCWTAAFCAYLFVLLPMADRLKSLAAWGACYPWPTALALSLARPQVILTVAVVVYGILLAVLFARFTRLAWVLAVAAVLAAGLGWAALGLPLARLNAALEPREGAAPELSNPAPDCETTGTGSR